MQAAAAKSLDSTIGLHYKPIQMTRANHAPIAVGRCGTCGARHPVGAMYIRSESRIPRASFGVVPSSLPVTKLECVQCYARRMKTEAA